MSETDSKEQFSFFNNPINENSLVSESSEHNIKLQLAKWASEFNITHKAFSSLLHILKPTFPCLPSDARSILHTPRLVNIKTVEPGQYFHFGFASCLRNLILQSSNLFQHDNVIDVCINIDGLPLSKSSSSQFYPILCNLFEKRDIVNIIGIYHGTEKPKDPNIFLESFVKEAVDIVKDGLMFDNRKFVIKIKAFICDVPAKSYIKQIVGHNAYNSCSKWEPM